MKPNLIYVAITSVAFFAAVAQAADPETSKPAELKVLERLVGKWDSESVSRVSEWTPKEGRAKGVLTREWVLNGRYVQETSKQSDADAIVMFTYDTAKSAYRWWLFNSHGNNFDMSGKWDEKTQTLTVLVVPNSPEVRSTNSFEIAPTSVTCSFVVSGIPARSSRSSTAPHGTGCRCCWARKCIAPTS